MTRHRAIIHGGVNVRGSRQAHKLSWLAIALAR
jgi:hypothetical protein